MENKYREGQFVWRELMTSDAQKARGFYGELFGWTFKDMPMPNGTYTLIHKGDQQIGGLMQLPPGAPFPPNWLSYVSVKNVDDVVSAATANGGKELMKEDVPGVGRIGIFMDAQGAALGLLHALEGDRPAPEIPGPGTFCWESLNTTDIAAAKAFYPKVVGWSIGAGPGDVAVLKAGTSTIADIGTAPPGIPAHWMTHVVVEKLEAACERVQKLGGQVMMAEIKVPTIGRLAIVADPTGAAFSLFEGDMSGAA